MYDVTMPKLSDSMEVGKIIRWLVAEGDEVSEGGVLAEVESDKAQMELESFRDGVVLKIAHGDGSEVPVGEVIAFIGEKGESVEAAPAAPKAPAAVAAPAEKKPAPAPTPAPAPARRESERVRISPYARKLAEEKGVDYSEIAGSGPGGRILASDITSTKEAAPAKSMTSGKGPEVEPNAGVIAARLGVDAAALAGTGTGGRVTVEDVMAAHEKLVPEIEPPPDEELPALEVSPEEADVEEASFALRTQARRVTASKHVIPHFYVTRGVNVTELHARGAELKKSSGATLTHLVMLAALRALAEHPGVNRSYDHGRIIKWKGVNLGLAVATEGGLTVAVLKDAGALGLDELVEKTRDLVERARAGKLSSAERTHATFTVTNLGMFDVEHFEPIINPPSAVTLAVSSALEEPVVAGGKIAVGRVMRLTLSCDHRIVDGVAAAKFLSTLKKILEDPETLLAGG